MPGFFGKKKARGLTLVELVVAMVLIVIVSVMGVEFLAQYQSLTLTATAKMLIANSARAKMEELYMIDPGQWAPGGSDNQTIVNKAYTRTWSSPASSDSSYALIRVRVQ